MYHTDRKGEIHPVCILFQGGMMMTKSVTQRAGIDLLKERFIGRQFLTEMTGKSHYRDYVFELDDYVIREYRLTVHFDDEGTITDIRNLFIGEADEENEANDYDMITECLENVLNEE